jgi:hypothetical protein
MSWRHGQAECFRPDLPADQISERLSEDGVSPEEVLRGVGANELHPPDTLISLGRLLAGCKNAIRLSCEPSLPFRRRAVAMSSLAMTAARVSAVSKRGEEKLQHSEARLRRNKAKGRQDHRSKHR